ncbi:hypothetical protein QYF61_007312, partial [Mycteria americana]
MSSGDCDFDGRVSEIDVRPADYCICTSCCVFSHALLHRVLHGTGSRGEGGEEAVAWHHMVLLHVHNTACELQHRYADTGRRATTHAPS